MKHASRVKSFPVSRNKSLVAKPKDWERVFAEQTIDLLRLALQMIADAEQAESCVILAMRDCFFRSRIARDQAHAWARRMVVRNAIRLVLGRRNDILGESGFEFHLQPRGFSLDALRDSVAILTLPVLDRLCLVICVLERYSILDCALLLGRAPQEVHDAIARAINQVVRLEDRSLNDATRKVAGEMFGGFQGQADGLEGSCGSMLD